MKKKPKTSTAVAERPPETRRNARKEDPWIWVEGLHPLGFWMPLFSFRKSDGSSVVRANNLVRRFLRDEHPSRELVEYDDFRVNMGDLEGHEFDPDPEVRARYASLTSQMALQGSLRRSKPEGDALQPPETTEPQKPSESRTKKRICAECRDENPKKRCIRKEGHDGKHKDAKGKTWR